VSVTLLVHIAAGAFGLLTGYVALFSRKGGALHRKAGRGFVYAMLTMAGAGFVIAALQVVAPAINIPAALLTASLVITALTTVRPASETARRLNLGATFATLGVGLTSLTFAFQAVANGGTRNGMPAFPFFMFGIVGMLAAAGDLRMMVGGELRGARRIARHLWRMSFALFIAAMSFFIGQSDEFPAALRIMPLLALPVVAVLVTMFYWLWRVRRRLPVAARNTVPRAHVTAA
jgi:uncharacterized membrane protein